jgi:hypothetical protein
MKQVRLWKSTYMGRIKGGKGAEQGQKKGGKWAELLQCPKIQCVTQNLPLFTSEKERVAFAILSWCLCKHKKKDRRFFACLMFFVFRLRNSRYFFIFALQSREELQWQNPTPASWVKPLKLNNNVRKICF